MTTTQKTSRRTTADVNEDFTIDDDETQNYVFDLSGSATNVLESGPFTVDLYADPARPAHGRQR